MTLKLMVVVIDVIERSNESNTLKKYIFSLHVTFIVYISVYNLTRTSLYRGLHFYTKITNSNTKNKHL